MPEVSASASAGHVDEHGRLEIVARLVAELERRGVRYCHWKSTPGLATALRGETDLDLLVDRADAEAFGIAIREIGFRPFVSHESRRYPAVEDHIGHDRPSGRLVHLHVYYQLILGQQYTKNHRLPLERAFLDGAADRGAGISVPPPALELMVLGIRTLLKYRDSDALKDLLRLGRRGGIPPDTRHELKALRSQVSTAELREATTEHLPRLPSDLVVELLAVLERDRRDALRLRRLRRHAARGLRAYERLPRSAAIALYFRARLERTWPISVVRRGMRRSELRRKMPLGGGVTIAVVGPDGAGKSTIVSELTRWLAWRLNLRVLYLGSAQPSPSTHALRWVSRAARRMAGRADRSLAPTFLRRFADVITAVRYIADARDRADRVRRGRSLAARGAVVLFDRFPLPDVRVGERQMDGPRIATLASYPQSALLRRLARREAATYAGILPPDCILQLVISAETALSRKGNRVEETVVAKSAALLQADLSRIAPLVRLDAEQPLEAVVDEAKAAVWKLL